MAGASARAACPDGLIKVIRSPVKNKAACDGDVSKLERIKETTGYLEFSYGKHRFGKVADSKWRCFACELMFTHLTRF